MAVLAVAKAKPHPADTDFYGNAPILGEIFVIITAAGYLYKHE
jgi:hypothetical protein